MKYKNIIIFTFFMIIIPNMFFLLYVNIMGLQRTIINFDYIFLFFIFYFLNFCSKKRNINLILSYFIFIFLFFIDVFFLIYQYFPFIKINDIVYLSQFMLNGPKIYIYALIFLGVSSFFLYLLIYKYVENLNHKKNNFKEYVLFSLILIFLCLFSNNFIERDKWKVWGVVDPSFGGSQVFNFIKNFNSTYNQISNNKQILEKAIYKGATDRFYESSNLSSQKILLVVNESWGYPRENIRNEILKKVREVKSIEYKEGKLPFVGATVSGELRELCRLNTRSFSLRLAENGFDHCLPHYYKKNGFETFAFHAAMSNLYDRNYWYPKAGFDNILTYENLYLLKLKKCKAFSGICDDELFPIIQDILTQDKKIFLYWLTLKSHVPYKDEILVSRFNCKKLNIHIDSETCKWAKIQTDFFDRLALLLDNTLIKDIEVVIVGDHPTPIFDLAESIKYFKSNKEVSYLYLKK